jgi:hypothetical protein
VHYSLTLASRQLASRKEQFPRHKPRYKFYVDLFTATAQFKLPPVTLAAARRAARAIDHF